MSDIIVLDGHTSLMSLLAKYDDNVSNRKANIEHLNRSPKK